MKPQTRECDGDDECPHHCHISTEGLVCVLLCLGLIRFRGHLLEGGYDVDHGGSKAETDSAQVHG
jgi:hypothetical protein